MVVSEAEVSVSLSQLEGSRVLVASESTLGNGTIDTIRDVVYVKPDTFDVMQTQTIAAELERINHEFLTSETPYLLIGFGRWGSSDPSGGIPVKFGQISAAKVIVEATLPEISYAMSQGSHFFHNITSFRVFYFSLDSDQRHRIDWDWLDRQHVVGETDFIRHVRSESPLRVEVDGKTQRGVIYHE
jgi:hypothetical protein